MRNSDASPQSPHFDGRPRAELVQQVPAHPRDKVFHENTNFVSLENASK